ncbi:MAG: hypothetical protein E7309_10525 [Butyrivibrio sp.]|jgi:hypothetical protein|nr:hypothetical protein [Butyrivibrio sp.]
MKEARINVLNDWVIEKEERKTLFKVPANTEKGFYNVGFLRANDNTVDLTDYENISIEIRCDSSNNVIPVSIIIYTADKMPRKVTVYGLNNCGRVRFEVKLSQFDVETAKANYFSFTRAIAVENTDMDIEVLSFKIRRRVGIYTFLDVKGLSGNPGDTLTYKGEIYNCTDEELLVSCRQLFQGWEAYKAIVSIIHDSADNEDYVKTGPDEKIRFEIKVCVNEQVPPGGHEISTFVVTAQGTSHIYENRFELKTFRSIPHPYLYHDVVGWKKVRKNIEESAAFKKVFNQYMEKADAWEVIDVIENRDYCYETREEYSFMSCAYMLAITGDNRYGEKLHKFFGFFSDPQKGYPKRLRGCSQSYVQEGHFFTHIASAYDILCGAKDLCGVDFLTDEDKKRMEKCLRLYLDQLDDHVRDGHISNWYLSELQGALFSALVMQDIDQTERFLFGQGGIIEQFKKGTFGDGWWHECSVGYNTWVSSIMLHCAHALLPFGYNLVNTRFTLSYSKEVDSTYNLQELPVKFGMYNQKWGGNSKINIGIKDLFDAPLKFLDERGVMFGIADSDEKRLGGQHFGPSYELAYKYYHDSAYLSVIAQNEPDCIFGDPDIPSCKETFSLDNAKSDNIGIAMVRSKKAGRSSLEQIQAVLRYGSHGNAHGHFDQTSLVSLMRYGRSMYNPENCWWGYAHFMYKFYVQCSLTKNMVVVDDKMQNPADSKCILFEQTQDIQAAGVEVCTRWSYPPYGGMVYEQDGQEATKEALRDRSNMNGCYLPIADYEGSPVYGELTGHTEEIMQRRVLALRDDYIVIFDYVQGDKEHDYDSLLQIKGFMGFEGSGITKIRHTEQMRDDILSDAQFITDCQWYEATNGSIAHFKTIFTQDDTGERLICDRSNYNEPGDLNVDVYTAWPVRSEQMIGRVAIYDGWAADYDGYNIPLEYQMLVDGTEVAKDSFNGWILGRGEINQSVEDAREISLIVSQGKMHNEIGDPIDTPQGLFWGNICLNLKDGQCINVGRALSEPEDIWHNWASSHIDMINIDNGYGIGHDYKNGRVTVVGEEYPYAVPCSPIDHDQDAVIKICLNEIELSGIKACIGVDAFEGDEFQRRKTYAVRQRGQKGRFVTVIEPYENKRMVKSATALSPDEVEVTLQDGTRERITLTGVEEGNPKIEYCRL